MPDPEVPEELVNPRLSEQQSARWPLLRDERRRVVSDVAAALLSARAASDQRALPVLGADAPWVETVELLLAERARRRENASEPGLPAHLSTSALVDLAADPAAFVRQLRRPVPTAPTPRTRVGTAFHAWVERHFAQATLVDLDTLEDETGADPAMAALQEAFLASEWADRTPVAVEIPVQTEVAGRTVAGRIDAVFRDDDGGLTVVDWKTGAPGSPEQQRVRAVQLGLYRLAYARLTGRAPSEVRAAFFYAATGTTIRPDLPEEHDLASLLGQLAGPT